MGVRRRTEKIRTTTLVKQPLEKAEKEYAIEVDAANTPWVRVHTDRKPLKNYHPFHIVTDEVRTVTYKIGYYKYTVIG